MVGGALITLLNNSDRVKSACLAQLVNVIAPIFAEPGGAAWRQTIFHPFKLVAQHAHGSVLQTKIHSTQCETKTAGTIDHLVASAVHDAGRRKIVFFVLNRDTSGATDLTIDLRGFPPINTCQALEIAGPDLLSSNTAQKPDAVQPGEHREFAIRPDALNIPLKALSWNLLSLSY
jgi:alpha-N-arabinofuranosidase